MQRSYTSAIVAAIVTVAAGQAMAQQAQPLTREQVRAELIEARRTGDIVEYETGKKLNQLFPSRYEAQGKADAATAPAAPQAHPQGRTREEVQAEFLEARRTGDIVEYETGKKLNELFPSRYSANKRPQVEAVAQRQQGSRQF